jgi:hypothetical protein
LVPGWLLEWSKILPLVGLLLYALLWTATSAFYSRLGIDPQALGINYGSILVKSAGAIVLVLLIGVVGVFTVRVRARGHPGEGKSRLGTRSLVALAAGVLVWGVGLVWMATWHANLARAGRVVPNTVLFLPYVPWRVWPAEVDAVTPDPSATVRMLREDCLFHLGSGNGREFFYDVDRRRTIHVPASAIIVMSQPRGARPSCPPVTTG